MPGLTRRMWTRVADWFDRNAEQLTVEFVPEPGEEPIPAYGGYVRLWLAEGFVARRASWGNEHFPALHGGLALRFLGAEGTPFTTFARPGGSWDTPGARLDFPVTALLPFNGGVVEVEAALYQASVAGPLATAVELVGSLTALLGPPLSAAVAIVDKLSDGLDTVLAASGDRPLLAAHWSMSAAGGGGRPLRSGHLAVVNAPHGRLPGPLSIVDGRLHVDRGGRPVLLDGVDFLLLRIECRTERDDWRFPALDEQIRLAGSAYLDGHTDTFRARRTEAICRAWNSPDLTPPDRIRVAKLVQEEIDRVTELGAIPGPAATLEATAPQRLLSPDAPELGGLTLDDLLDWRR